LSFFGVKKALRIFKTTKKETVLREGEKYGRRKNKKSKVSFMFYVF